jgi:hypothetical protein
MYWYIYITVFLFAVLFIGQAGCIIEQRHEDSGHEICHNKDISGPMPHVSVTQDMYT